MKESILISTAIFFGGLLGGFFGSQHMHDVRDIPHGTHEVAHGQPFDVPPATGFTVHGGEMILVVDGDRVLTFYRDDIAEVCADLPSGIPEMLKK